MKYFTVEEAEALIPQLEQIYECALRIHTKADAKAREVRRLEARKSTPPSELALERAQLQFLVKNLNECLESVVNMGALPKGLEPALVDFPYRLDGREVYLCWKMGETRLAYYHDLESGYGGRQALPEAVRKAKG